MCCWSDLSLASSDVESRAHPDLLADVRLVEVDDLRPLALVLELRLDDRQVAEHVARAHTAILDRAGRTRSRLTEKEQGKRATHMRQPAGRRAVRLQGRRLLSRLPCPLVLLLSVVCVSVG